MKKLSEIVENFDAEWDKAEKKRQQAEKPRSFEAYWERALQRGTPEWLEREYREKTRQPLAQTIKNLLQIPPPAPKKPEDSD